MSVKTASQSQKTTKVNTKIGQKIMSSQLPKVRGSYREDADLSRTTWFRSGGAADILFKPADYEDLSDFFKAKSKDVPVLPLGVGSNLLVRDGGISGVVVRLGRGFTNIAIHNGFVDVGAGMLDTQLSSIAVDEGLDGLEFLAGIPGTIGGALRMNAGCYGTEMKDILEAAFVMDTEGKVHTMTPEDMGYKYRHCDVPAEWIFIGARLKAPAGDANAIRHKRDELMQAREESQPVRERTGGSTFANPDGHKAWELIDKAGCRGLTVGGAMMSEKHCNFMINTGNATSDDLETLGETVRERVKTTSGVDLRWEIQRVGSFLEQPLKKAA